jgi:two-component system, NtrC family, sensor histidine kinase HydH
MIASLVDPRRRRSRIAAGTFFARKSIAVRLIVFAVLLASGVATLVGSLSYTRARRALEHEAQARLAMLAREVVEDLHRELEDRVADITNWSHLEIMRAVRYRDVDKQLAQFFRQLLIDRDIYRGLVCVDLNGTVVAAAGDTTGIVVAAPPRATRIQLRQGDGAPSPGLLQLETAIADPDRPGSTLGTLVAVVEPLRMLRTARSLIETVGPHIGLVVRTRTGTPLVDTSAVLPGGTRDGWRATDVLTGSAAVPPLTDAVAPDLRVVVVEPSAVALAAVDALGATLLRVAIMVIALGSGLGALVAWWISRPIRRLTSTVQAIAASGRVDAPVQVSPMSGEVGILATAFEGMMRNLAEAQAETLAQSRLAVLGEVAANVAHEVRTPLAVLKTSAQLLTRAELPPDEKRRLGTLVVGEVDRLNRVVTDLVDLGRPRSPQYRKESMPNAVDRALAFFSSTAKRRGVTLARDVADTPMLVNGSADQLHQVLVNLVHNAMQAVNGTGCVTVRCRVEGAWIVVEVDDTGSGFAPEVLDQAFTRFLTTREGGAGLGLVISRRIVEEHGGVIEASNLPHRGARVSLRLPVIAEGA